MKINLRELRLQKGLTTKELAKISNVSVGTINRIENRDINPTVPTICKLCAALDVPINKMIECERDCYDDDEW